MNSKIKNIIFDFGGVILDIEPDELYNHLKKAGFQDFECLNKKEFTDLISKFEKGIYTAKTFRKKALAYLNLEKTSEQGFDDIWNSILLDIPKERIEAIEKVKKNYNIYLMSNSNEIHYDLFVRDLQLRFGYHEFDALFDKSYFSFDVHLAKPDPNFFEYILDQHSMKPEETLFIDDTEANIKVAQKLGIHTYWLKRDELVRNLFEDGVLKENEKIK